MRGLDEASAAGRAGRSAKGVVERAVAEHHPNLVLACSFQKEESVLIDMLMAVEPAARVFTIDTGVLFPETYAVWKQVEDRYGVKIEVHDATGAWTGPEHCCGDRKVAALERALEGASGWITGLRREQSPTRADAQQVEMDKRGLAKFSPLADWTELDVWRYVHEHDLPYHPLHDRGYASIGCAPCTQPGSGRDGRWAGELKTECGLHV